MKAKPPSASRSARAFTLLEVLIALAVVAVTLLAAMRAVSAMASNTERLRQAVLAETCAENWLGTAQVLKFFPPPGQSSSECTQGAERMRLTVLTTATLNPSFVRVDVVVENTRGESVWRVSALLRRP